MCKPAVGCRTMPMLHACRNMDNRTGKNLHRRFTLFLIPASSGYTDKHLAAAFCSSVYVPVVAATRLECDIGNVYLLSRNGCKITVANEILRVCRIRFTYRENHLTLECCLSILSVCIFRPHILGKTKSRPCLWPTCIKPDMRDNLRNLRTVIPFFFADCK